MKKVLLTLLLFFGLTVVGQTQPTTNLYNPKLFGKFSLGNNYYFKDTTGGFVFNGDLWLPRLTINTKQVKDSLGFLVLQGNVLWHPTVATIPSNAIINIHGSKIPPGTIDT